MNGCSPDAAVAASPERPGYRPVKPPPAVRRREVLRQALQLPRTLRAIRAIIAEDFQAAALDEHLWAFAAYHGGSDDPHCHARLWRKVRPASIDARDVVGMPIWELAFMLNVSREIEEPILEYSRQNGEGFRFLLPALARYLGRNREEAAHADGHGLPWCDSPWCAEERRHASAFARVVERLTGLSPGRENPNRPKTVSASETDAVRLVLSRESAEWNSSSTYVVMAAHATGELHHLIRNIARDEVKHLGILSAVDLYLFGPRPWRRFADLVRESLGQYRGHQHSRTGGDLIGTSVVTALEVIAAHLLAESFVRRWIGSLPIATLAAIFEAPSGLPERAAIAPPPERQAQYDAALRQNKEKRDTLARWKPDERRRALEQRTILAREGRTIALMVDRQLDGFRGTDGSGSRGDSAVRRQIGRLGSRPLRACLRDRLRDHQIRNNRHVLATRHG